MTGEEAAALAYGDLVAVYHPRGHAVTRALVLRLAPPLVVARRLGRDRRGRRHPERAHPPGRLTLVRRYDGGAANVLADWLDDHREPEAAHLLRSAFPFETG